MNQTGTELKIRNEYISKLNQNEFALENSLRMCRRSINLNLPNVMTVIKNKNFELEKYFYEKNIKYYSESAVAILIFLYLEIQEEKATSILIKLLEFEKNLIVSRKFKLPLKNPHIERYNDIIEQINSITLDDTLIDKLYNIKANPQIRVLIPFLEKELSVLKSPEYSKSFIERLRELIANDKTFINNDKKDIKKKRLML